MKLMYFYKIAKDKYRELPYMDTQADHLKQDARIFETTELARTLQSTLPL